MYALARGACIDGAKSLVLWRNDKQMKSAVHDKNALAYTIRVHTHKHTNAHIYTQTHIHDDVSGPNPAWRQFGKRIFTPGVVDDSIPFDFPVVWHAYMWPRT